MPDNQVFTNPSNSHVQCRSEFKIKATTRIRYYRTNETVTNVLLRQVNQD